MIVLPDISDLLDAPFRMYGRDSECGISCMGVVLEVVRRMGFVVTDPKSDLSPDDEWEEVKGDLEPGDVFGFAAERVSDKVGHVGVYLGWGLLLHATPGKGTHVSGWASLPRPAIMFLRARNKRD